MQSDAQFICNPYISRMYAFVIIKALHSNYSVSGGSVVQQRTAKATTATKAPRSQRTIIIAYSDLAVDNVLQILWRSSPSICPAIATPLPLWHCMYFFLFCCFGRGTWPLCKPVLIFSTRWDYLAARISSSLSFISLPCSGLTLHHNQCSARIRWTDSRFDLDKSHRQPAVGDPIFLLCHRCIAWADNYQHVFPGQAGRL